MVTGYLKPTFRWDALGGREMFQDSMENYMGLKNKALYMVGPSNKLAPDMAKDVDKISLKHNRE